MENSLKYGDLILFKHITDSKLSLDFLKQKKFNKNFKEINISGYLKGNGFINTELFFEGQECKENDIDYNLFTLPREYIFYITPKWNFEIHKEYKKTLKYYTKLCKMEKLSENQKTLKNNFKFKLTKLLKGIENEIEINKQIIKENNGNYINYGDEIQLCHYDSNSYIKSSKNSNQTNKIGFNCNLSNWNSNSMIFKIKPKFKSRQDGENIQFKDHILLYNNKFSTYLFVDIENDNDFYFKKYKQQKDLIKTNIKYNNKNCSNFKIFLSQEIDCSWQINLFKNYNENEFICGEDIIRLRHTENNSFLASSLKYNLNKNEEVYINNYDGKYKNENFDCKTLWIIQHNLNDISGKYFKIVNNKSVNFKLKHFLTKKYLNYDENELVLNKKPSKKLLTEPIMKNLLNIKEKFTYYLFLNGLNIKSNFKFFYKNDKILENIQNDVIKKKKKYMPLKEEEIYENRNKLNTTKEFTLEDAFIIEKINEEEKLDILIPYSAMKELEKYLIFLVNDLDIKHNYFIKIETILKKLILYLYKLDWNEDINFNENFIQEPSQKRQRILKNFNLIDNLIDMLYFPLRKKKFNNFYGNNDILENVIKTCYNSLRITIMEYRPNELYTSQWLELLLKQSLNSNYEKIGAGTTFQELIDNNDIILEKRITKEIIAKFISNIINKEKTGKNVDILRAICICNGQPLFKNQKQLTLQIILNEENFNLLIPKIEKENNSFFLTLDSIKLNLIDKENNIENYENLIEFYTSIIWFISELCQNRNYKCINHICNYYGYLNILEILINKDINLQIKEAFCSLMKNLWIDKNNITELKFPILIKLWGNFENEIESKKSTLMLEDLNSLQKKFILKEVKNNFKKNENNDYDFLDDNLSFINNILKLINRMFELNLFDKNNLKKLIKNIKKMLIDLDYYEIRFNIYIEEINKNKIKKKNLYLSHINLIENCQLEIIKFLNHVVDIDLDKILNSTLNFISKDIIQIKNKNYFELISQNKKFLLEIKDYEKIINNIKDQIFNEKSELRLKNNEKIIKILLNLFCKDNENLQIISIQFINKIFNYSYLVKKNLNKIFIITNDVLKQNYKLFNELKINLESLSKKKIKKWLEFGNKKIIIDLIDEINKRFYTIDNEKNIFLTHLKNKKIEKEFYFINNINSNEINQNLFKNIGLYKILFKILKILLSMKIKNKKHNEFFVENLIKMINLSIHNNNINKNYIIKNYLFELIIPLIEIFPNSQLIILIFQLSYNNKLIFYDNDKLKIIIKKIVNLFGFENITYNEKSIFIKCLLNFVSFENKISKSIQNIVVYELFTVNSLENKNSSEVIYIKNNLVNFLDNQEKIDILIFLSKQEYYFISVINLLTECGKEKNAFTENIGQNYFNLKEILSIINSPLNIYLSYKIADFFFHVYLETEKKLSMIDKEVIPNIIEIFIEDISLIGINVLDTNLLNKSIEFNLIEDKFNKKLNFLNKEYFYTFEEIYNFKDLKIKYLEKLCECILYLLTEKLIDKESIGLKNKILISQKKFIHNSQYSLLKILYNLGEKYNLELSKKLYNYLVNDKKIENNDLDRNENIKSNELNYIIYHHLKKIINNKPYNNLIKKEFKLMVRILGSLGEEDFIKKMIKFLHPNYNNEDVSKIFGLKILNKYLNLKFKKSLNHLNLKYDKNIRVEQLIKYDCIELICEIIKNGNEKEIFYSLKLSNSLLEGGNKKAQNLFAKEFLKYEDNIVLINLKKLLDKTFNSIKISMGKLNDNIFNYKIYNNIDNYYQELEEEEILNIDICTIIFNFLQLLCEGHNLNLQNWLRIQKEDNFPNVDFIVIASIYFGSFIKFVNSKCCLLGEQILSFLVESIQGPCYENQIALKNSKIIETCKDFLIEFNAQKKIVKDIKNLSDLVKMIFNLLNALLEGKKHIKLINSMANIFGLELLSKRIYEQFEIWFKKEKKSINELHILKKKKLFPEEILAAFEIYFFINTINYLTHYYDNEFNKLNNKEIQIFNFLKENTGHIEIFFNNDLIKIYFPIQPACRYLSEYNKENIMDNIKRDTPNDKLSNFMSLSLEIFDTMDHLCDLRNGFYKLTPRIGSIIGLTSLVVNLLINLIYLLFLRKQVSENVSKTVYQFESLSTIVKILQYIFVVSSGLDLIIWYIINGKIEFMNKWRNILNIIKKKIISFEQNKESKDILEILNKNMLSIKSFEIKNVLKYIDKKEKKDQTKTFFLPNFVYYLNNINILLRNNAFIWKTLIFTLCVFALITSYENRIIYSFLVLDIINHFETLKNVPKAVTHNSKQLLLTAILGIILIYIYTLFGFYFFPESFFMDSILPYGENNCTSVWQCFLFIFSLGPRSSGGIGDVLLRQSFKKENENIYWIRFLWDVTAFLWINVIFMNIIFGIIIDTFAELRYQKNKKDIDKKNICYICSLERYIFDKFSDGFESHKTKDHNPWNYLFYLYYIKKKEVTDYNGIESYISEKYKNDEITWFPLKRALCIKVNVEEEDDLEKEIKSLENTIKSILEKLEEFINK